jgi:UDP-glucose 4-epimerase
VTAGRGLSLVVGGTGFIGGHLVRALVARGTRVRVMARGSSRLPSMDPSVEVVVGDVGNQGQLAHAIEGVTTAYHLASSTVPSSSAADPAFDIETNVVAALPLLGACAEKRIRLVFTSSGGTVYGRPETLPIPETHSTWPISTHGVGKLTVEKLLHAFGCTRDLDYRILRLSNVYGEGQSPRMGMGAVAAFLERTLAGRPIEVWGDGSQRRDFLYVADAIKAIVRAADLEAPRHRVLNIGSGKGTAIAELCELIFKVCGRRTEIINKPARRFDVPVNVLDIQRASDVLAFEPSTSLEEGVRRAREWLIGSANARAASPEARE